MECQEGLQAMSGISSTARRSAMSEANAGTQRGGSQKSKSLFDRILRKIFPDERKNERHSGPPLVGHLGMVHTSKPYEVADISISGFCLLTDERWEPGTEMPITLRRTDLPEGIEGEGFTVQATVVRSEGRRVGFSIALVEKESLAVSGNPLHVRWITRAEMQDFLDRLKGRAEDHGNAQDANRASSAARGKRGLKAAFEGGD